MKWNEIKHMYQTKIFYPFENMGKLWIAMSISKGNFKLSQK